MVVDRERNLVETKKEIMEGGAREKTQSRTGQRRWWNRWREELGWSQVESDQLRWSRER